MVNVNCKLAAWLSANAVLVYAVSTVCVPLVQDVKFDYYWQTVQTQFRVSDSDRGLHCLLTGISIGKILKTPSYPNFRVPDARTFLI